MVLLSCPDELRAVLLLPSQGGGKEFWVMGTNRNMGLVTVNLCLWLPGSSPEPCLCAGVREGSATGLQVGYGPSSSAPRTAQEEN